MRLLVRDGRDGAAGLWSRPPLTDTSQLRVHQRRGERRGRRSREVAISETTKGLHLSTQPLEFLGSLETSKIRTGYSTAHSDLLSLKIPGESDTRPCATT